MKYGYRLALCSAFIFLTACTSKQNVIPAVAPITPLFQPTMAWSSTVGSGSGKAYNPMNPSLINGKLYVTSDDGKIAAFNAQSGQLLWQTQSPNGVVGSVGADANRVAVGTNNASLLVLDASSGQTLWNLPIGNLLEGAPLVTSNAIVYKNLDDSAAAIDPNTQKNLWQYQRPATDLTLKGGSAPILANGQAVMGFDDGSVAAFSLLKGNLSWEQSIANSLGLNALQRMVSVNAPLKVDGNTVYAAAYQGSVAALNASTGSIQWTKPISSYAGFALTPQAVIISSSKGNIVALARSNGHVLWHQRDLVGRKLTAPVIVSHYVVVADNAGDVHWLNTSNGQFVARVNIGKTPIYANPVASGNDVFIYNTTGRLVDLRVS